MDTLNESNFEVFTEYGNDATHPWGASVGDLVEIDAIGSRGVGIVCKIDENASSDNDYCFSVFYLGGDKCDWDNNGEDSYDWVDTSSAIGYETKVTILRRGVVDFEAIREMIRKITANHEKTNK